MSTQTSSSQTESACEKQATDAFLPLFLFGCAFIVFLGWQVARITRERSALQDTLTQRGTLVVQSQETQKRLEKLVIDLIEVSKTSSEARRIVTQFNIQFTPKAGEAAAATAQ